MKKKSLTVVLPVHNREAQLKHDVEVLLELAGELTDRFSVVIVDDGSTDDTYETANELVARFPQVSVLRHSKRGGLSAAMNIIRKQIQSDVCIVHDGVSRVQATDVRRLWQQQVYLEQGTDEFSQAGSESINEFAEVARLHYALEQVHQRVAGFQLISSPSATTVSENDESGRSIPISRDRSEPRQVRSDHVGVIPPLPRPRLFDAVTNFALGE